MARIAGGILEADIRATLERIGLQLDQGVLPRIKNGGIVAPSDFAIISTLGEEKFNVHERSSRAASSERAPGWAGPVGAWSRVGGPWPASQTAPIIRFTLKPYPQEELDAVRGAYPGAKIWQDDDGFWLLTESSLLRGLRRAAIFLTGISYSQATVRSWGFWKHSATPEEWIGPRHTNFPDGSVCAFFPDDGTWAVGDPLVELLDLFSLWALRHLHLQMFGRWPGAQAPCHPYERLLEFTQGECCGCSSNLQYGQCCQARDLVRNRVADAVNFTLLTRGGTRAPPELVVDFMAGKWSQPPRLAEIPFH